MDELAEMPFEKVHMKKEAFVGIFVYIVFSGMQYSTSAVVIHANERSNVTLPCASNTDHPEWKGPEGVYNYANKTKFNPALGEKLNRLSWGQNKKNLIISNVVRNDSGEYFCFNPVDLTVTVPPSAPKVMETENKDNVGLIVRGSEGVMLTLTCRSFGGFPDSNMVWMKGSTSLQTITNKTYMNSSETFNIIGTHTFTPSSSDDRVGFICKTFFEIDPNNEQQTKVTLFLNLKPSKPTVIQTSAVSVGGTVEVRCTTMGCRPAANISWSYQRSTTTGEVTATLDATTETYTVVSLFRREVTAADNGRTVQCIVTHPTLISPSKKTTSVKINVHFSVGHSTTRITGNKEMTATGLTTLTLTCTTGSSNPASDITWKNDSVTLPNKRPYNESAGDNNGVVRSQQLILYPTRYMDGDSILCSVSNTVSQSDVVDTIMLNLTYRPLIEPMPEVIAVEGNNSILTCVASSKPASTFQWYREGQSESLHHGNGTLGSNKLTYTIRNVRRTATATYRCNANNGIESADNENVLLTVYYPPDVTVEVEANTTVNATAALLSCSASGMPNSNYKYGKWIQTWNGVQVSEKPGNEKLELKNLTYEHSGVYTCSASNGIKVFGTNKEFMEGSVLLVVKSFPIITNASEKKTPAKLKENATLEVYYYSNAARSEVKIYRNVNGSKQVGVIYTVSETHEKVNLHVFGHIIKTVGTRAKVTIQILSTDELGPYDVVVANEIGSSTRSFEIVPKGPPSKPYNVTVDSIQYNTAHLSWIRGYHGGLAQTFVIQLSTDLNIWRNITVDGGLNESLEPISEVLSNLYDSTMYYIRMYAFNNEGSSPFTEFFNFTTPPKTEDDRPGLSEAVIGGAAGGISALFVLVLVIVIVLVLKRRGVFTKGKENSHDDKNDRTPVYADEDDYGMQDNPMYVSAGPRNQKQTAGESGVGDGAVYSTVDKNRIVVNSSKNDVYAEVDKTNKTKANKGKEKKVRSKQGFMKDKKGKKLMQDGDLYENATTTEMKDRLAKRNKNEETIYENPEPSKPSEKKNVNKDGLIYADLTFNDQPKGQKKLVIHGLDSMTEYVQVDFTKKADPLPDSDDENNSPKNST